MWWCSELGGCDRDGRSCTPELSCHATRTAYAFTEDDLISVFATRAACEADRTFAAETGARPSACTKVGPRPVPRPRVPRGRGFYCLAYTVGGTPTSTCDRSDIVCSPDFARETRHASLQWGTTFEDGACERQQTAWATQPKGDEEAVVKKTREQCEAYRALLGGYPCVEIK